MIYIEYADISATIAIPVGITAAAGEYTLALVSTVGREELSGTVTATRPGPGYLSVSINPVTLGLTVGEWEYTLTDADEEETAVGIMSVTGDGVARDEYEKNISYEQYEII